MEQIEVTADALENLKVDAVVRVRDSAGFFDEEGRRLMALIEMVRNCQVIPFYLVTVPEVMLGLQQSMSLKKSAFGQEVLRVGGLIEKFVRLVEPGASVEVDYPKKEGLLGRKLGRCYEFQQKMKEQGATSSLRSYTPYWLEDKVDEFLDEVIPEEHWMLGSCHSVWGLKKTILAYCFNIDWKSPAERNPRVIYD